MDKKQQIQFSQILSSQCKELLNSLDKMISEEKKELQQKIEIEQEEPMPNYKAIKIYMGEADSLEEFLGKKGNIQNIEFQIGSTSTGNLRVGIASKDKAILNRKLVAILGSCIRTANIREDSNQTLYSHIVFPLKCKEHFDNCVFFNSLFVFII